MQAGDKNSSFFHNSALTWRKNNHLDSIWATNGEFKESSDIVHVFIDYFRILFSSSNASNMHAISELVGQRVNNEMQADLDREFTTFEVRISLSHMGTGKSPGPNGVLVTFCNEYWDICRWGRNSCCFGYSN